MSGVYEFPGILGSPCICIKDYNVDFYLFLRMGYRDVVIDLSYVHFAVSVKIRIECSLHRFIRATREGVALHDVQVSLVSCGNAGYDVVLLDHFVHQGYFWVGRVVASGVGSVGHVEHQALVAILTAPTYHLVKHLIITIIVWNRTHQKVSFRSYSLQLEGIVPTISCCNSAHMSSVAFVLIICLEGCNLGWGGEIGEGFILLFALADHLETAFAFCILKHDVVRVETIVEHSDGYSFSCVGLGESGAEVNLIYACRFVGLVEQETLSALSEADAFHIATLCQLLQLGEADGGDGEMIDHGSDGDSF